MRELDCLRCSIPMKYVMKDKIQLGEASLLLGDLFNLLSGAIEVEIYCCPQCGKIEFFNSEMFEIEMDIAKTTCPQCNKLHDIDFPKCPFCKYNCYD